LRTNIVTAKTIFKRNANYRPEFLGPTATHLTRLGTPRLTVSKILGHAEGGITAIYDRHSYDKEKREALDLWGQKLKEILAGESREHIAVS